MVLGFATWERKHGDAWGGPDFPVSTVGTMTPVRMQNSLTGQTYSVPLIQPDLRREEAIQQVADALQYLQKVSGDIFSRWVLFPCPPLQSLPWPLSGMQLLGEALSDHSV